MGWAGVITTARTGDRFGNLVVLVDAFACALKGRKRITLCRCDCGTELIVRAHNLTSGNSNSCFRAGCPTRLAVMKKMAEANRGRVPEHKYAEPGFQARNYIFLNYRSKAKQRGRTWDLDFEQFCSLTQSACAYCGEPPSNSTRDRNGPGVFTYNGLDRVDPARGYTPDNVVPACIVCNRAKSDMSRDDFLAWVGRVASRMGR